MIFKPERDSISLTVTSRGQKLAERLKFCSMIKADASTQPALSVITGRALINLPRIEWRSGKLNISLISIDNGTLFELKRRFESYQQLLNWYGTVLDKLG